MIFIQFPISDFLVIENPISDIRFLILLTSIRIGLIVLSSTGGYFCSLFEIDNL